MQLPTRASYVVIGAGVHGLSTAWHLAKELFRDNAYIIADSNHGYKMIGVGALVAKELMDEPQELLEPSRFSRSETGELHPTSHSPFPWS
jgi:hypothetical protein